MKKRVWSVFLLSLSVSSILFAQPLSKKESYTRQDTLRGTNGPGRTWWDVLQYKVEVSPDYIAKSIKGKNTILFKNNTSPGAQPMQIDLQEPMILDSAVLNNIPLSFKRDGNAWFIQFPARYAVVTDSIQLYYHGTPRIAKMPPWDGGWIWVKDKSGKPWMSVACQGLGASVWYPCKDYQGDEPDNGATLSITVPDSLIAVGNGRLMETQKQNGQGRYTWQVTSPINNYNIIPYIGDYVNFTDTLQGEKGKLDLSYWVLAQDLDKAKKQFEQVKPMLRAFEYWFGPYPFYEDGYKLVQSPHLGMEHQSAVAYGNGFVNGYRGSDLSGSGWGLKWDYIIVHESGHEWFANNITTKDIADMWIHEGFTDYSETLFTEYYYGKKAADEYLQGLRKNIANDKPIIGPYGVNQEGSGDMYFKGANLIHTIRQIIDNDAVFRDILRGLNKTFYHQTVTSAQVEEYFSKNSRKDLKKVFDQYLRTTQIPELELKVDNDKLKFKWTNCVSGFNMPVKLTSGQWIFPTTSEQKIKNEKPALTNVTADPNFYIKVKEGK